MNLHTQFYTRYITCPLLIIFGLICRINTAGPKINYMISRFLCPIKKNNVRNKLHTTPVYHPVDIKFKTFIIRKNIGD